MQQYPRACRSIFAAPAGSLFGILDFQQIEVALAAIVADDRDLMEAVATGDVYSAMAAKVFGENLRGCYLARRDAHLGDVARLLKVVLDALPLIHPGHDPAQPPRYEVQQLLAQGSPEQRARALRAMRELDAVLGEFGFSGEERTQR
jgi:hypothetical protein